MKSKIISYAEKYGLKTSGTAKDICVRIKEHLYGVGKKIPEIVEEVLDESVSSESSESSESESSESEEEIELPKGTLSQLKSELTKKNSGEIFKKYSHLVSRDDLENFNRLDSKDQTLFINLFNNNEYDFHSFLEYFIKERDYKRFFASYTVRIKKGMSSKDIIKEFGHLLDKLVLAKFNVLSDKKKLSIGTNYLTSNKSLTYFIPIDECRSDYYEHCSENKEVCNIDLGQCVREEDLESKYDSLEIDGKRIIGNKDSLDTLKKKLNIKTKEDLEREESEKEREREESEKRRKKLLKREEEDRNERERERLKKLKREKEEREEEEENRRKLERERRKKLEADKIAAEKREEREKIEAKKRSEMEEESGYIDKGRLAPASPRLKKPSDKPFIDSDLFKPLSPFKPKSKPKTK